jgi:hypothetical protein
LRHIFNAQVMEELYNANFANDANFANS